MLITAFVCSIITLLLIFTAFVGGGEVKSFGELMFMLIFFVASAIPVVYLGMLVF